MTHSGGLARDKPAGSERQVAGGGRACGGPWPGWPRAGRMCCGRPSCTCLGPAAGLRAAPAAGSRRSARGWRGGGCWSAPRRGSARRRCWPSGARGGGQPVAWLGLDAGDSDPARFWRYVVVALDQAQPRGSPGGWRCSVLLALLRSFEGLVTALINELAAQPGRDEVLLVLDHYHLVDAGPVHESVAFLLENLPPGLLLVVSGRG